MLRHAMIIQLLHSAGNRA